MAVSMFDYFVSEWDGLLVDELCGQSLGDVVRLALDAADDVVVSAPGFGDLYSGDAADLVYDRVRDALIDGTSMEPESCSCMALDVSVHVAAEGGVY